MRSLQVQTGRPRKKRVGDGASSGLSTEGVAVLRVGSGAAGVERSGSRGAGARLPVKAGGGSDCDAVTAGGDGLGGGG
jgi:hypothetical protein